MFFLSVYQDCLLQSGSTGDCPLPPSTNTNDDGVKRSLRKRRITFADVQGFPLESVRELAATDATYTPGKIVPWLQTTIRTAVRSKTCPLQPRPSNPRSFTRQCQFTQPVTLPDFFERTKRQNVMLETVTPQQKLTHGTVRVTNIAYDKEVVVRWTRNKWTSFRESRCHYCQGSGGDGSTDRFCFTLPTMQDDGDIEFVIRYKVEGREFWDNNNKRNYVITIDR